MCESLYTPRLTYMFHLHLMCVFFFIATGVRRKKKKPISPSLSPGAWFHLDTNGSPPTYYLKPITSHFPAFGDSSREQECRDAENKWWGTFAQLQRILRAAAIKTLSPDAAHAYVQSG